MSDKIETPVPSCFRQAVKGGLFGLVLTLLATGCAIIESNPIIPELLRLLLQPVLYLFFFAGSVVTYSIVGDDYVPTDFYRFTVPISLLFNTFIGAAIGFTWRYRSIRKGK
jgi:hypothetical protein